MAPCTSHSGSGQGTAPGQLRAASPSRGPGNELAFLLPPQGYTNLRAPGACPFLTANAAQGLRDTQKSWCAVNSTRGQPNPAGTRCWPLCSTASCLSSTPRSQLRGTRGTRGSKGEAGHPQTAAAQFRLFPHYYYYFKQAALLLPLPFAPFPLQFPQHCPASLSPHRLLLLPRTEARQRKTQHQAGPPPRYLIHSKNTSHQLGTASLDNSPSKKCPDPSPGASYHMARPLPSP